MRVRVSPLAAALLGVALAASLVTAWPTGNAAILQLLAAQVLAAALLTLVVLAIGRHARSAGLARLSAAHGVGLQVLAALFFLYYGSIDLRLPVAKELLPPLAGVLLGVAATFAVRAAPPGPAPRPRIGRSWPAAALAAAALLVLPVTKLLTAPEVRAGEAAGFPVRIMTYNLHLGIDPWGRLDLESIAQAIEAHQPDVVALQEVSRGWLLGGSADMFTWLSRRLDMPGVFAGTADPLWGNAVLSRRPILDHSAFELPTEDLLIRRGLLTATIDLGPDGRLEVIANHFHHLKDGGEVRKMQALELLEYWQGRPRTAILGDLNARPEEPPIELLRRAGLGDVTDLAGISPGYTAPTREPVKRIDYIWISPDLEARDVVVGKEAASDHLPVAATLEVAELKAR